MDEEIERLVVNVRADTAGFARDVAAMRASLEGPMEAGAARAGRAIDTTLARALRTGKLGFEDLGRIATAVLGEIAVSAVQGGLGSLLGGAKGGSGGGGLVSALLGLFGGAPGRATGGPVSPGRPYWVGERGPELFVPTSAGRVEVPGGATDVRPVATPILPAAGPREVRVAITVNARGGEAPAALAQSGRQVARAVRAALMREA
ncbi:tail tape measure protein [Sphingomonas spermidinifaciens]|uniref:Tail tape measure protein n=1 Tax=Sphingomonas spermidinifaciens TaxID=1141889 RepID=A0A2A4B1X7_9SPHN|nr:tail tape measure protein [Sphingomonas spermidinifaciens]PCD01965.1 tail tape measure protein [Sphingomonas spermidinifaciens]